MNERTRSTLSRIAAGLEADHRRALENFGHRVRADVPSAAAAPPTKLVTSVHVQGPNGGGHEYVTVFIRGQCVGTLCVGAGDGEDLRALLLGGER